MNGILESILNKRYGNPELLYTKSHIESWWNRKSERLRSVLYSCYDIPKHKQIKNEYRFLYGDFIGGFLVGDSLKIANLSDNEIFGLYQIKELQQQPEIPVNIIRNRNIKFFMDAANVWFFGFCENKLFVYDAETEEFDDLGDIESGIEQLIEEWEKASN